MSTNSRKYVEKLYQWYDIFKRSLPWRETNDPYIIWLSEVILQQTRVQQGLPYFYRFVSKYPTIADLAKAETEDVLSLWQGLGYYSRARNMLQTAKNIIEYYPNGFPNSYNALLSLKGIGPYTAAAIASFAYNLPHPVCDGNVIRVISRLEIIIQPIQTSQGKKAISEALDLWFDPVHPALFNQSIMELGALICTPKNPHCTSCPFMSVCKAYASGVQVLLPVKKKAGPKRKRRFHYLVLLTKDSKKAVLQKRNPGDVWEGLYEFILLEDDSDLITFDRWKEKIGEIELESYIHVSRKYMQVLSHQKIEATFYVCYVNEEKLEPNYLNNASIHGFYDLTSIENIPKPVIINKFIAEYFK